MLTGMVKSYNKRGFGFIMCQQTDQDIYFSRDSLHPNLRTSDLAGEHVAFEIHKFPDGKMQARNLRPLGDVSDFVGERCYTFLKGKGKGQGWTPGPSLASFREEEDRSRDWYCKQCGERNFVKRFECFKCKSPRQHIESEYQQGASTSAVGAGPRRSFSPHAGSRAVREVLSGGAEAAPRKKSREPSSSSSESSRKRNSRRRSRSRLRSADKKRHKGSKRRSKSSSSSGSSSSGSGDKESAKTNPEIEKAKAEALEKLLKLQEVESREQRMKEWRTLLREWHPDKNPDRQEVATAVFQFLQKGKQLLDK